MDGGRLYKASNELGSNGAVVGALEGVDKNKLSNDDDDDPGAGAGAGLDC